MSHARLIFEDTPAFIPVPSALLHRKTEIIFLTLDDEVEIKSTSNASVSVESSKVFSIDNRLSLSDSFFASLQTIDIENPLPLTDLSGKVPACFKSAEDVDAFIRAERDAWDD